MKLEIFMRPKKFRILIKSSEIKVRKKNPPPTKIISDKKSEYNRKNLGEIEE